MNVYMIKLSRYLIKHYHEDTRKILTLDIPLWYYVMYTESNHHSRKMRLLVSKMYKFRPTWPSSSNTYYVQNTFEKINSTENYKKR
jgi:hypothetical protein